MPSSAETGKIEKFLTFPSGPSARNRKRSRHPLPRTFSTRPARPDLTPAQPLGPADLGTAIRLSKSRRRAESGASYRTRQHHASPFSPQNAISAKKIPPGPPSCHCERSAAISLLLTTEAQKPRRTANETGRKRIFNRRERKGAQRMQCLGNADARGSNHQS